MSRASTKYLIDRRGRKKAVLLDMAKCPLCGGERAPGTTIFSVDLGDGVVVIRAVPAQVCSQCGEEWIDDQTAKDLEDIVEQARKRRHQVEVLTFPSSRA